LTGKGVSRTGIWAGEIQERRATMRISRREVGKVRILDVEGNVFLADGESEVKDAVVALLTEGHRKIILNLTRVSGMDSAGLGSTIACKKRCLEKEAELKLVIPKSSRIVLVVRTCLQLAFEIFEDETEAVGSFVN
jgi:anti-sigma B factor antagonist